MQKTNAQHLRDIIETSNLTPKKYEKAMEFIEAMEKGVEDLDAEIDTKDDEIRENESTIRELEDQVDDGSGLSEINMGYGTIWYKTDNLKLQMYMESLSERLEAVGV